MTADCASTGTSGARAIVVQDLKTLKAPEEGGSKKEYEDFLDRIQNHVTMAWDQGKDIGLVVRTGQKPDIEEPKDLTETEAKSQVKTRLWNMRVDRHFMRGETLDMNVGALYALLMENVSKMVRAKIKSKKGYSAAETDTDAIWLLANLEDIMINFEDTKPKILAIDDQMERIMKMKQGDSSNEDFIKLVQKEIKVYEKHGGDFLWGTTQKEAMKLEMEAAETAHMIANKSEMDEDGKKETQGRIKKELKSKVTVMAILKRADKKRYGNLQIGLKNQYLLGNYNYPSTVPSVLNILNNYETEWTGTRPIITTERSGNGRSTAVSFLVAGEGGKVKFLKGTTNTFYPTITCNKCGFKGHYKAQCPVATETTEATTRRAPGNGAGNGTGNGAAGRWVIRDLGHRRQCSHWTGGEYSQVWNSFESTQ